MTSAFYGLLMAPLLSGCQVMDNTLQDTASSGYNIIKQAEVLPSDIVNHPPADSDHWQPVILPDNWNITRPGQGSGLCYRFPISSIIPASIDGAKEKMAVMLPRLSMNASVWLDNYLIGDGGSMDEPLARNWHRPLYFKIPPSLLHSELFHDKPHWLYVYVRAYPNDLGGLGWVYFGQDKVLLPMFKSVYFLDITLSNIALIITLIISFAMFILWLLRRQNSIFGWMAASGLFWSIVIANQVIVEHPPFDRFTWEWLVHVSVGFYVFTLLLVAHRFIHISRVWLEKMAFIYYVLTSVVVYLFAGDELVNWFDVVHVGSILLGVYIVFSAALNYHKTRQAKALGLGLAVMFVVATGVYDWLLLIRGEQLTSVFMMQFAPPMMLLFVGGWMIFRFSSALDWQEKHNILMQQEIEKTKKELSSEHNKRLVLERAQTLTDERQRFTRELHDGMGGHLVALKSMLANNSFSNESIGNKPDQHEAIMASLDNAILDMRLVIEAIDDSCDDVGMIMGMLRARVEHQMKSSGLEVSWNMVSLPLGCLLRQGHALHLIRILQEAMTNIIRHAEADWVDVRVSVRPGLNDVSQSDAIQIIVADNGCGLPDNICYGQGIKNMRERIAILDGELEIKTYSAGTIVQLTIPMLS